VSRDVTFFGIQNKENKNEPTLNVENTLQCVFVDEEINQENQDDEEDQESSDEEDQESSGHDQDKMLT
jgi:hypothetical protein